ncbi:MAG: alpha/beta hydrolase [Gammaproteobacteria bacterium]|nr:alpha/beta hydrolase [Gammaproteobacteria bacterium]
MLSSFVLIILALCLGVMSLLYVFQEKMIFFPGKRIVDTPGSIGLHYEDVYLVTEDDVRIHGWYVPHVDEKATVLFFHGNAGNISHRLDSISIFHDLGLSVFIIDYRGYGRSEGRPSEKGTYRDAIAAWNYLVDERRLRPDEIILFGRSLGGGVAAGLAARVSPAAVILESTFTSIKELGKHYYPYLPVSWIARVRYPVDEDISSFNCPVLVIHSEQDDVVPFSHGQRLFATAREPKMFLPISGDHNTGFLLSGDAYVEGMKRFLVTSLDARY